MTITRKFPFKGIENKLIESNIYSSSRKYILLHNLNENELNLSNYIFQKYGMDLKQTCLYILNNLTISSDGQNFKIVISDRKPDLLARLITFGNKEIRGTKLLINSFGGKN